MNLIVQSNIGKRSSRNGPANNHTYCMVYTHTHTLLFYGWCLLVDFQTLRRSRCRCACWQGHDLLYFFVSFMTVFVGRREYPTVGGHCRSGTSATWGQVLSKMWFQLPYLLPNSNSTRNYILIASNRCQHAVRHWQTGFDPRCVACECRKMCPRPLPFFCGQGPNLLRGSRP